MSKKQASNELGVFHNLIPTGQLPEQIPLMNEDMLRIASVNI